MLLPVSLGLPGQALQRTARQHSACWLHLSTGHSFHISYQCCGSGFIESRYRSGSKSRYRSGSKSNTDPDPVRIQIQSGSRFNPDPDPIRIQIQSGSRSNPDPVPIRIQIQSGSRSNPDPDPIRIQGFDDQKLKKKKIQLKFFF